MTWSFHPIFDSYWMVVLLTALLTAVMATPLYRALAPPRRFVVLALRAGVVLLMLAMMLRPTWISTRSEPQPRMYMVLFDRSRSMQLPDADGDSSRWERLQALLDQAEPALRNPGEALEVRLFAFDDALTAAAPGAWRDMEPAGAFTDLGGASDAALRQLRGKRLIGATILSDGVQTAYDSDVDIHRAAREMGRLGVPLLTVPLGPPGDATKVRDVAMENLPDQLAGFVGNELTITGVLKVQGYASQPIPVRMSVEAPQGGVAEIGVVEATAAEDGQSLPVRANFTPPAVGDYKLTMRAEPQDGEMVTANNELTCYIRAREGLKVAYLYGTVLGEQRALRWSLSSGAGIQLATRYINPLTRKNWPLDQSDLLGSPDIDAFLLESVPAAAFRQQDLQRLADQVAGGKGLMMLGGYYSFGPGGYQEGPLENVLPVTMGRFERQDVGLDKPLSLDLHWAPDEGVQVAPAGDHPITRLDSPAGNAAAWRRLPPLLGINRLEPATFAQVIAVAQNGLPVLISSQFGEGRVLAFAGDTTHRWWSRGRQEEHKRFWRQAVMWLIGRDAPKSDVWVNLPRRRFQPGARVTIRGGARDDANNELDAQFQLTVTAPDGRRLTLPLQADGREILAESEPLRTPGDYQLELQARQDGALIGKAESSFQVIDRDVELATAAADHQQLARLAMLTNDAGGQLLQPDAWLAALDEQLAQPPTMEVDTESRWELGDRPGDAWLLLLAMTLLLTVEWGLRKRWGLV